MKKSDLKNGMIVEYRNGFRRLVVNDELIGDDGHLSLTEYNDDLKINELYRNLDIIKVYKYKLGWSFNRLLDDDNLELIWERKEYELTKREIEILKALKTLDYEFLVRNESGMLYAIKKKPEKKCLIGVWYSDELTLIDKDLFTFIKWEDEEPTNINELLKELEK